MRNVSRDRVVAAFEELVAENQIQTATELLISADAEDQLVIVTAGSSALLHHLFQALDDEDRLEVLRRLSDPARDSLLQSLTASIAFAEGAGLDEAASAAYFGSQDLRELEHALPDEHIKATGAAADLSQVVGRRDFNLVDGRLHETTPDAAIVTVYTNPSGPAQRELLDTLGIDEHTLASVLDPDEVSRLEHNEADARTFIVWKRPRREVHEHPEVLGLASVGLFLQPDHLTIVTADASPLLRSGDKAESPLNLLLHIMAATVSEFLVELKAVKRTSRDIQSELSRSLENRQLLRMFSLSEGLVYHINAVDANGGVLRKVRALAERLGLDELDRELLDDIIIDNNQCSRQGQVFSTVLGGMLDARGNLINNNMNVLLKNLTIINVVFLPLGVIASLGGMSEFTMIIDHYSVDWRVGYPLFVLGLALFGLALWLTVPAFINRTWQR